VTTTAVICTVVVILAAIYDLIAVQVWGIKGSISKWFQGLSKYPVIVFAMGYMAGHWLGFMSQ